VSDLISKKRPALLCLLLFFLSALLFIAALLFVMAAAVKSTWLVLSLFPLLLLFVLVLFNLLLNSTALALKKNIMLPIKINRPLSGLLYGLAAFIAKVLGVKEQFERSFIALSASLLGLKKTTVKPEELLVLLPRCIQNNECKYNIVNNLENCISCGKCDVKEIREIVSPLRIKVALVTGGSQARALVDKLRPKAIIAVACERELVSGIFDVPGCEVLGIINERPEGPCINTRASVAGLKEAVDKFLTGS